MRNKIAFVISALTVIPTLVFICAVFGYMTVFFFNQKLDNLNSSVSNLSEYIYSTYSDQLAGMRSTIDSPELEEYILDPENPEKLARVQEIFFNTFNVNNAVKEVSLTAPDGTIYLTSDASLVGQNLSEDTLIKNVLASNSQEVTLEFDGDIPLIAIGYPIIIDGRLLAIYKRVTPLNYVSYFARNANSNLENIYLLTKNDRGVLYREQEKPNAALTTFFDEGGEIREDESLLEDLLARGEQGGDLEGHVEFEFEGNLNVGSYSIIEQIGWICMVSQPRAVIFYDLNVVQAASLVCFVILAFLIYFVLRWFLLTRIKPLDEFEEKAKQVLEGDYSVRCSIEGPGVVGELGQTINGLTAKIKNDNVRIKDLERQINNLLTVDQITGLSNNRALYSVIDEHFGEDPNQALVMVDTGIYNQIQDVFGNSVANRMLEVVGKNLVSYNNENTFLARISEDLFCFFIAHYDNEYGVIQTSKDIKNRLTALPRVDDLQVQFKPHVSIVFRDDRLLGRSDWLRLSIDAMKTAREQNQSVFIFDYSTKNDYIKEDPQNLENILHTKTETREGFSGLTHYVPDFPPVQVPKQDGGED